METLNPKNSEDLLSENKDINEDITEIGLPKSCLITFVKEILTKNKIRGDKNIIPMLDKISKTYVTYLSSLGCKICTESKKKTLNVEHILEALKRMKFDEHIKLIVADNIRECDSDKYNMLEDDKKIENKVVKQFINKKQKRKGKKKKCFENDEERENIKKMQAAMFEEARMEYEKSQMQCQNQIALDENDNGNNDFALDSKNEEDNYKKHDNEDLDKDILINKGGEEDINFD